LRKGIKKELSSIMDFMKRSPLKNYLRDQLDIALQSSYKVSSDSDIKHLHKFRVSLRRARSLYKVFYPEANSFDERIKEIVQKTNELRELDVLLSSLNQERYPMFFKEIGEYRRLRFQKVWTPEFLEDSIGKLIILKKYIKMQNITLKDKRVITKIEKFYFKTLKAFNKIDRSTPEKKLHKLRIRFKVSRYALEFLNDNGLADERENIFMCKKRQYYFGDIQDLSNQVQFLKGFCKYNSSSECRELAGEYLKKLIALKNDMKKSLL